MQLSSPITLRAASLTLTGTIATVVGTVSTDAANATTGAIPLAGLNFVTLVCSYVRPGGGVGVPRFAVDISCDPPATAAASVANFIPMVIEDTTVVTAVVLQPLIVTCGVTAAGTTTRGTQPWAVGAMGANWIRVRVLDLDGAAPGAIVSLSMGGSA